MTPFIFSDLDLKAQTAWLYGDEAKHCVKVMRKRPGEAVIGIDGRGWMHSARIKSTTRQGIEVAIESSVENWGEKPQQIRLLVSPLHKADRFEWLVEKAVELGVTTIAPYLGKHTVKTGLRLDRLERIAIAALKQSMRSRLPEILEPVVLEEALEAAEGEVRLLGHGPSGLPFAGFAAEVGAAGAVDLLIGPEGDFDEGELDLAQAAGFRAVGLGLNRLRSETAAIHLLGLVKSAMAY